jgi:mannose-binding lectin 2
LWTTKPLSGLDGWSATIKFRVSGQGKTLFGDGFAFWYSTSPRPMDGTLMGVTDRFSGFAVVFDTFKNSENAAVHKDVAFIASAGEPALEKVAGDDTAPAAVIGCDSKFRYWEKRADWSVSNAAAVRLTYTRGADMRGTLRVEMDERNSGKFVPCFEVESIGAVAPGLAQGWDAGAHLGLSGSTGALADNHDVLSFVVRPLKPNGQPDTADESGVAKRAAAAAAAAADSGGAGADADASDVPSGGPDREVQELVAGLDSSARLAYAAARIDYERRIAHVFHHLDHQLIAMKDGLEITIKKIQEHAAKLAAAEGDAERRIAVLEDRINSRFVDHSAQVQQGLEKHSEQARMHAQNVASVMLSKSGFGTAWVWPFVVLLLFIGGIAVYFYKYLKKAEKRGIL